MNDKNWQFDSFRALVIGLCFLFSKRINAVSTPYPRIRYIDCSPCGSSRVYTSDHCFLLSAMTIIFPSTRGLYNYRESNCFIAHGWIESRYNMNPSTRPLLEHKIAKHRNIIRIKISIFLNTMYWRWYYNI